MQKDAAAAAKAAKRAKAAAAAKGEVDKVDTQERARLEVEKRRAAEQEGRAAADAVAGSDTTSHVCHDQSQTMHDWHKHESTASTSMPGTIIDQMMYTSRANHEPCLRAQKRLEAARAKREEEARLEEDALRKEVAEIMLRRQEVKANEVAIQEAEVTEKAANTRAESDQARSKPDTVPEKAAVASATIPATMAVNDVAAAVTPAQLPASSSSVPTQLKARANEEGAAVDKSTINHHRRMSSHEAAAAIFMVGTCRLPAPNPAKASTHPQAERKLSLLPVLTSTLECKSRPFRKDAAAGDISLETTLGGTDGLVRRRKAAANSAPDADAEKALRADGSCRKDGGGGGRMFGWSLKQWLVVGAMGAGTVAVYAVFGSLSGIGE